jgi:hypothetical protein
MPQSHEGTKFIIYIISKALKNNYFVSLCLSGNKNPFRSGLNHQIFKSSNLQIN